MITKAQADTMFTENAVLIGTADAMPECIAQKLLSQAAVDFVCSMNAYNRAHNVKARPLANIYGIGDYQLPYLTYTGFLIACTYCNVYELEHA